MSQKPFEAVTAMAATVIAFMMATPLLIPLALVILVVGCGLCCVLAGAIGAVSPPA